MNNGAEGLRYTRYTYAYTQRYYAYTGIDFFCPSKQEDFPNQKFIILFIILFIKKIFILQIRG